MTMTMDDGTVDEKPEPDDGIDDEDHDDAYHADCANNFSDDSHININQNVC